MKMVLLGSVGLAVAASVAWAGHQALGTTCVIGVTGTEATVAVSGWGARQACEEAVAEEPRTIYRRDAPASGVVLCEVRRGGRTYVVRDDGVLMVVGRGLCLTLTDPSTPL